MALGGGIVVVLEDEAGEWQGKGEEGIVGIW